jgi:hypothetical protein
MNEHFEALTVDQQFFWLRSKILKRGGPELEMKVIIGVKQT